MANEERKEAVTKARTARASKVTATASEADAKISENTAKVTIEQASEPVDLMVLHRDIEAFSHDVYKARKLYVIAAFIPNVEDHIAQTIFGGVTVRPNAEPELMLSNGERTAFKKVQ
jgi:hypothetical protein